MEALSNERMVLDHKVPFVVTHKDTGIFVKYMVDEPAGTQILGSSHTMTFPEWIEIWGRVHGVKGTYKELSSKNVLKLGPKPVSGEPEEGFKLIQELDYCGRDLEVINIEDVSHTSIREFISHYQRKFKVNIELPLTLMEE